MRGRIAIAAGLGLVLGWPALAAGSTVSVQNAGGKGAHFLYEAEAGERNRLVATGKGFILTVRDSGATVAAGPGCESLSEHAARCDFDGTPRARLKVVLPLEANLGGRADRAKLAGGVFWSRVSGGSGRDVLLGGRHLDRLDGGVGPDKIIGRGSTDVVQYFERTDDVKVTLGDRKRNDGGRRDGRKRDLIRGVEDVGGGLGDDVLVGTDAVNLLFGREGNDVLRGRGGPDDLFGDDNRDTLRGGRGADNLQGQFGNDRAFGGRGADAFTEGMSTNGADLFVGGDDPGDAISYARPVRIELDGEANDGSCVDISCAASDEGDDIRGVRVIRTFTGADVVIGSRAPEEISPSQGADVVQARGGDDTIVLSAGDGPDQVDCGTGTDTVMGAEAEDTLVNCE